MIEVDPINQCLSKCRLEWFVPGVELGSRSWLYCGAVWSAIFGAGTRKAVVEPLDCLCVAGKCFLASLACCSCLKLSALGRSGPRGRHHTKPTCWSATPSSPHGRRHAAVRNVYDFCLQGVDHSLHAQAAEVPSICAVLQRHSVPDSVLSSLGEGLHFVEAVEGEVKVDILVGQDFYWRLMTPERVSITPGLVAQRTIFGWVMSGLLPEDHSGPRVQSNVSVSHQLPCCDVSESMVRKFWDLESVGIVGRESQLEWSLMWTLNGTLWSLGTSTWNI